ncbi:hypothetical protein Scep_019217 [Stephania cephalantha]|uniref:Uncharacterized protein n=1 Tax=Stephania cephalantha TaxID=152367 RepID=A0AAP0NLY2_9MAGN
MGVSSARRPRGRLGEGTECEGAEHEGRSRVTKSNMREGRGRGLSGHQERKESGEDREGVGEDERVSSSTLNPARFGLTELNPVWLGLGDKAFHRPPSERNRVQVPLHFFSSSEDRGLWEVTASFSSSLFSSPLHPSSSSLIDCLFLVVLLLL